MGRGRRWSASKTRASTSPSLVKGSDDWNPEPLSDAPVARFERRGPGLHHLRTAPAWPPDRIAAAGIELIDEHPEKGSA